MKKKMGDVSFTLQYENRVTKFWRDGRRKALCILRIVCKLFSHGSAIFAAGA